MPLDFNTFAGDLPFRKADILPVDFPTSLMKKKKKSALAVKDIVFDASRHDRIKSLLRTNECCLLLHPHHFAGSDEYFLSA